MSVLWQRRIYQTWQARNLWVSLFLVGATLAASATAYLSYQVVRGLILENIKEIVLLKIRHGGEEVDRWLASQKRDAEILANTPTLQTMDWQAIAPYFNSELQRRRDFTSLYLGYADGSFYSTASKARKENLRNSLHFSEAMAGKISVSASFLDPLPNSLPQDLRELPGRKAAPAQTLQLDPAATCASYIESLCVSPVPKIAILAPIRSREGSNSAVIGVAGGEINIEPILEAIASLKYGAGSYGFILNSVGQPILRPEEGSLQTSLKNKNYRESFLEPREKLWQGIASQMVAGKSNIELVKLNGRWIYLAYAPLEQVDWSVGLVIPRENLEKKLKAPTFVAWVVGGLLGAATLAVLQLLLVSERARVFADRQALLNRLTGRIRASLELEQILQTTVEEMGTMLDLERVAFGWYDSQKQTVAIQWQYPEFDSDRLKLRLDKDGLQGDYLTVPVATEKEVLGYLLLATTQRKFWKPAQKELLQAVADSLAIAITQSQLYTQTKEEVKRLAIALDQAALVAIADARGIVTYVNDKFCQICQYSQEELLGQDYRKLPTLEPSQHFLQDMFWSENSNQIWKSEVKQRAKDGIYYWVDTTVFPFPYSKGMSPQHLIVSFDITHRKWAEDQLRYQALHDALTGLPNRTLLMERLRNAIGETKLHPNYQFALLFLDLDRFKVINDSLGHLMGDRLLEAFARRLEKHLHATDIVSRFGGDEFILLLEDIQSLEDATSMANRIQKDLTSPFNISGYEVFATASIGIALGSNRYQQPEDIIRDADTAMYSVKSNGKADYALFDQAMHDRAVHLLKLEQDLRRAVDRQEFQLYYQPIVCLKTGKIAGFEALVRWQNGDNLVSPVDFIPLAEETRLIVPLGKWILATAYQQLRLWQQQFPQEYCTLTVAVNVSVVQLSNDFIFLLDRILQTIGTIAPGLKIEITESAMMQDVKITQVLLEKLHQRQVPVSIDDFGTGYSSLAYLSQLAIDTLKIDRSFVKEMNLEPEQLQIVKAIVTLARSIGMELVAEGVETKDQLERLQELGCQYGQGYLFSRPLTAAGATALLSERLPLF